MKQFKGEIDLNSHEVVATNTIVGGGLGKSFENVTSMIQKNTNDSFTGAANYISGLFTQSSKSVAANVVEQSIDEEKDEK